MKAKGLLFGAAVVLALSAPSRADVIFDNTSGIGLETTGTVFMNGLYEGYEALSEERTWATDLLDGEHFNHKARRAARRASVMPDEIMDRDLLEADIPDLSAGLVRLRTAYDRGGRTIAPALAATAQVSFDCWIEAAEGVNPATGLRTHSAWRQEDVERCRDQFEKAMAELEPLTTYRLTEFRKPAGSPAAPMPVPQIAAAPEPFTVYFAWDSAAVDGAGNRVIDDAVASADDLGIVDYTITGHADRSGAEDYNLQLSLRRADAVRSALISRGVKEGGISVAGRGEAEPAVQTADGVREPANRRVEIILL